MGKETIRIGMTSCMFHHDPKRNLFKGKRLLYMEEMHAQWVMSKGALPLLLPTPHATITTSELVKGVDGLMLTGGTDICPKWYGEKPMKPEWAGDEFRDQYEMDLLKECMNQNKPVFGVCRGAQLINVAMGGSMYQDINTQVPESLVHRDWHTYDENTHEITFNEGSLLRKLYPDREGGNIITVHHQAIRELGRGIEVEAVSTQDGIIEAIRLNDEPYVYGVQWHPEWKNPDDTNVLDQEPLLEMFLGEIKKRC